MNKGRVKSSCVEKTQVDGLTETVQLCKLPTLLFTSMQFTDGAAAPPFQNNMMLLMSIIYTVIM